MARWSNIIKLILYLFTLYVLQLFAIYYVNEFSVICVGTLVMKMTHGSRELSANILEYNTILPHTHTTLHTHTETRWQSRFLTTLFCYLLHAMYNTNRLRKTYHKLWNCTLEDEVYKNSIFIANMQAYDLLEV